jgi:hypothetical protein
VRNKTKERKENGIRLEKITMCILYLDLKFDSLKVVIPGYNFL